jgi:hypothetical protein
MSIPLPAVLESRIDNVGRDELRLDATRTLVAPILLTLAGIASASAMENPPSAESPTPAPITGDLVVVDVTERPELRKTGLPVIWKSAAFILAEWNDEQQRLAREAGIAFETLARDLDPLHTLYLVERPEAVEAETLRGRVLLETGRSLVVERSPAEVEAEAASAPGDGHASQVGAAWVDVCASGGPGSGDGILDPGESALLPVTLENDGNAALTGVSGTLTTTSAGVEIIDPVGNWPDLTPGASAESLPNHFGVQLAVDAPCGAPLNGDLSLAYAQGANTTPILRHTGLPQELLLLDEDFAGGIPAGWTVVDGGIGGGLASTWTDADPHGHSPAAPFDPPFVIVDSDYAGRFASQDEELITPSLDATGCQELVIEFSNQFNWDSGGLDERSDVDLSLDGGGSWTNVLRMNGADDGYPDPNTKTVDLLPYVAAEPDDVTLRFHYYDAEWEWWWAIDNVVVRCAFPVCTPCDQVAVPPGEPGLTTPLTIGKNGQSLSFEWGAPAAGCGAADHMIYRGDLTTLRTGLYAHDPALTCSTGGPSFTLALDDPRLGTADYFLIVAGNGIQEGSYGKDGTGVERPASAAACHAAQNLMDCGP